VFWIVYIGFTDHLYTRLVSTSNYSAITNHHNSQITKGHSKPFQACCVISRSLATASNSADSSALRAQVLSERRLPSNCLFSSQTPVKKLIWLPQLFYLKLLGTDRVENRFQQYLYRCMRIRCSGNMFTEPLPRNCSGIFAYLAVVA
jgi:hypothetical protein